MATRRRKKKSRGFSICLIIIALLLIAGCGLYILKEKNANTIESTSTTPETSEGQSQSTDAASENNEKAEVQDDLFGLFLDGKIDAVPVAELDYADPINASDLNLEGDEWDSYHFYDYRDVNNDGDAELVLSGPYGYSLFDIRDNKVVLFEDGQGTGATCSLANYKDAIWIVQAHYWGEYGDFMMRRYEGSTLAETIRYGSDENENGEKYFYRSLPDSDEIENISESEYNELIDSILQD
jgi:hypothetical protein